MRQITGGHAAEMTQVLQGLVSKQALTQEGQGRWTRYRLPVRPDSLHKPPSSPHKTGDSLHKAGDSPHKPPGCPYKDEKPGSDAGRPEDEWEQLRTIAASAPKKRRSPQETEQLILKLCRGRWLSRNQLAELLGRNPEGVRARFLVPMVEHGLLRLRYPDKPNRADQAYTAGDGEP